MVRTDPVVRAAVLMILLPIVEATWTVQPASSDPVDLEAAEFLRRNILDHLDWPRVVWNLIPVRYGHAVAETVYEPVEWDLCWTDPDGVEQQTGTRTMWALAAIQPRLGRTIWQWNVNHIGVLESITQQRHDPVTGNASVVVIPVDQLIVIVNEQEGDDYLGVSVCRSMYRAWYTKERLEVIDAMKVERAGVGVPVGYIPDQDWESDSEEMQKVLAGLRSGEESHLVLRSGDTPDDPGQRVEMLDMKASAQADALPSLQYHCTQILWAVLGAWQNLGHGEVGARATATVQDDPFYLALRAVAGNVASALNRQLVPRLVGFNYPVTRYPRLCVEDIQGTDIASLADGLARIIEAGGITQDEALEKHLRGLFGMPDKQVTEQAPARPSFQYDLELGTITINERRAQIGLPPIDGGEVTVAEAAAMLTPDPPAAPPAPEGSAPDPVAGDTRSLSQPRVTWREPTALERHVPLTAIDEHVETQRQRVQDDAAQAIQAITDHLATTAVDDTAGDLTCPPDLLDHLASVLTDALNDVTRFGRQTVRRELASQRGHQVQHLTDPPATIDGIFRWVQKRARASARAIVARMIGEGERLQSRGVTERGRAVEAISQAGSQGVRAEAVAVVSQAFSAGRRAETKAAVTEGAVTRAVYSSVLDSGTCDECQSRDGREYQVDSPEFEADYPPAEHCSGRDRCRCMMVLIADDEVTT